MSTIPFPTAGEPSSRARWRPILGLAAFLAVCLASGAIGAFATATSLGDWYPRLQKPPWTPPNGLFAPVWTTLYLMMAIAAWLVWLRRANHPGPARRALGWFGTQLVLNIAWSWIFFAARSPGIGLVEVITLWIAIAVTIVQMARVSRPAAALMIPYLAWVTFASALNAAIWWLNR